MGRRCQHLLVVVGVVLSRVGLLSRTLSRMETRFDVLVRNVVDSYGMAESSRKEVGLLMNERYPWHASLTDFILPPEFCAADRTLSELKLRKKTGASVIAVYRGDACIANPPPEFQLLPSDVLVLLGEKEHLSSAADYLGECCKRPHPQMEAGGEGFHLDTAVIPKGSILGGKTLMELAFRSHTGASVVGLERFGVRYTTLLPETILQEGDVLLLLGKPKEVANAKELVEGEEQPHALIAKSLKDQVEDTLNRG
jgi:K+/H+ antiporter YhaU regulatory subunit KhtT